MVRLSSHNLQRKFNLANVHTNSLLAGIEYRALA
jgi:hypothetical protein